MKRRLDLETWVRRPHFEFFRRFEDPFYGVSVVVDCTEAYRLAKDRQASFFHLCIHRSLRAVHRSEPFKYRIEGVEAFVYDRIDAAVTIARSNGTFGYGHIMYAEDLTEFLQTANLEAERVRSTSDLVPSGVNNVVLYSALPRIDFTSLSHARMFSFADSRPRITFGKMTEQDGKRSMPVSIHVHHALVDGSDVGQYIECFQDLLHER